MPQRTIKGSETLAHQIKFRRNELGLTITEAASHAGVGIKTWCRYEAGESIRRDKCRGICKALNWSAFPEQDGESLEIISVQEYKKHEAWSELLEHTFGPEAAISFAAGSDILHDHIIEDMEELSSLPAGTHIGQLAISWLKELLPKQFLMYYDYKFLYQMNCSLLQLRKRAKYNLPMTAHSVMEELIIYLCSKEASILVELSDENCNTKNNGIAIYEDWVFDLFDDMDIISFLYSDICLDSDHSYHYSHWTDQQFYTK